MGRRSSGGRSSYRRSAPKTSKSTTPARASSGSSVPVKSEPRSGGFVANMVATVADGFIWSTGNAMAHRAMDAIMGPRTIQIENVPAAASAAQVASSAADKCAGQNKAFNDCINSSGSDISKCQFYMDKLSECRKSGSATPIAVSF
ncbi:coiled-coil-helix-coiled-coil-helix domain-containing protein 10, mitochondrial [Tanacetum coccineum]